MGARRGHMLLRNQVREARIGEKHKVRLVR
jgi:hypothetical protein